MPRHLIFHPITSGWKRRLPVGYFLLSIQCCRTDVATVRFVYQVRYIHEDEESESPDEAPFSGRTIETALVTPGIEFFFSLLDSGRC